MSTTFWHADKVTEQWVCLHKFAHLESYLSREDFQHVGKTYIFAYSIVWIERGKTLDQGKETFIIIRIDRDKELVSLRKIIQNLSASVSLSVGLICFDLRLS